MAVLLVLSGSLPAAARASGEVLIVVSGEGGAYQEFTDAVRETVAREVAAPPRISTSLVENFDPAALARNRPALIVTAGTRATEHILSIRPAVPVLAGLVPRLAYEDIRRRTGNGTGGSAIYLDQPVARQLQLIRTVIPSVRRIGTVLGPVTEPLEPQLRREARAAGLEIDIAKLAGEDRLIDALSVALGNAEAFLALPDTTVSNATTVPNLLLTTYRRRIPVFAYSWAYARAGAMVALYSTPAQLGRHAGEIIAGLATANRWALPPARYPKYFEISVNDRVVRSLGISVPDSRSIETRLYEAEGRQP